MESSEDDAGAATSASRRASAREKDVGLAEDVDTTLHFQHELSETRGSCGTPTMSEDNFDGDSIPSPSAKDTSTEAILDMIDDLIGDPRVPRRVPLVSPTNIDLVCGRVPTPPVPSTSVSLDSQHNKQPEEQVEEIALPPCDPSPTIIANSESHHESVNVLSIAKCSTPSEILISANTSTSANPLQMSSPVQVGTKENCSTQEPEIIQNVEPEMSTERPIVAPTLNDVENIQDTIVASECENLDRTVKCVTSSENRDNVTVELAESTSSECSVSESKLFAVEPTLSRSPLKRRLIRPAPSDRRPDSTVSSTADSQIPDILTTEQTSSETITKDVSSSSDAMPNVHGTSILDEISKVSEISICKAETSTTPTRKIKLVRPKVTSVISNSLKTETQIPAVLERECCQSTSDDISTPSLIEPLVEASSSKTVRSEEQESRLESVSDNQQQFVQIAQISLDASSNSQEVPSNEVTEHSPKVMETLETPKTLLPIQVNEKPVSCAIAPPSDPQFSIKEDLANIQSNKVDKQSSDSTHGDHVLNAEKNVPLAKLCLSVAIPSESETTKNILEAQCSSTHIDKTQNSLQDEKTLLSPSVDQSIRESSLTINCEGDSEKTDHKKVPPIKLNLTDHLKNSDLMSSVKTLNIMGDDELTSHKSEDSLKQVPKLTIKLTNEYNQGAKSPVPKLTIKPLRPPAEQNIENSDINQQMPSVTNINIKPIPMPDEKLNESESNPVLPTSEQNISDSAVGKEIPSATKVSIKAIPKPTEKGNEEIPRPLPSAPEQVTHDSDTYQEISSITKINIKPISKETEQLHESLSKPLQEEQSNDDAKQQIPIVTKINIKSITKPLEEPSEDVLKPLEQSTKDVDTNKQVPSVTKINIKPIAMPKTIEKQKESEPSPVQPDVQQNKDDHDTNQHIPSITKIHIKPIIKPNERINESISKQPAVGQNTDDDKTDPEIPNVTKLTIKPILKPTEKDNESTSLTSETSHTSSSVEQMTGNNDRCIPNVTKINIKPIPKPTKHVNDNTSKPRSESVQNDLSSRNDQIPNVTKLNIKPIVRPPEKINEMHRKSSSSEISESEYSENDESTSTSDQASTSDQGPLDSVPKVTIKLGKPGTESEGKFYTEKNVPKVTMKNVLSVDKDDHDTKSKLKMTYSDDNKQLEKIPKITIKTVIKPDSQPLSPKLTIKPLKPPDNVNKDGDIPKLKISTDSFTGSAEVKENQHVPKIIIKPVTKTDPDVPAKTPKKSTVICGSSEHIPVVTKLNIKPILKPTESGETSERFDEKVPVVSKLNIKPVIKPKDIHVDPSIEDVPKVIKLNIKPLKNPEVSSSEEKDCDEMNADMKDSIPVVTKLNIKPIVKPIEEEVLKDSENQSSETGNSSDDNADHIPIVTKINIKPIVKPSELEQTSRPVHSEQCIPVVTKLNIKPLVKPEEISSPSSPKKELLRSPGNVGIPVVTKLNIKPIVKPEDLQGRDQDENLDKSGKHSLVMKINVKNVSESMSENEHLCNNINLKAHSPKMPNSPRASKRTAISESNMEHSSKTKSSRNFESVKNTDCKPGSPSLLQPDCTSSLQNSCEPNVVSKNILETNPTDLSSSKEQLLLKPVNANETVASDPTVSESEAKNESIQFVDSKTNKKSVMQINEVINEVNETNMRIAEHYNVNYTKPSVLNCTLLKQLLSSTKEVDKSQGMKPSNSLPQPEKSQSTLSNCNESNVNEDKELQRKHSPKPEKVNDFTSSDSINMRSIQDVHKEANESVTKPLEIITDKMPNQDSGQDSPRIILKINKTDHGASAKIITEETHKPTDCSPSNDSRAREDIEGPVNATASPKKHVGRRKAIVTESPANLTMGKRLRSSRIVESAEKSPAVKRNVNKRSSATETISPPQHKESELSVLESKKMKLEQILSANKSLTITPVVSKVTQTSPSKSNIAFNQGGKVSHNHSLLNNENCSQKNGNSKLHNILSNLQAKQMQTLQLNDANTAERTIEITTEIESNTSTGSSDVVVEITRVENYHPEVQEMLINENSICDLTGPEEVSQDPLEVESVKTPQAEPKESASIQTIEVTPTPRKRGRPRKLPLADTAKPPTPAPLPVPALEERPQRSLRLMRERPAILRKPRGGRGRGRGGRRAASPAPAPAAAPSPEVVIVVEMEDPPIDPTSSRIKLPRMTEALDKSVAGAQTDLKLFSSAVVLESPKGDEFMKSPEAAARPRSGRGSRGGRGRTPRNRGRGRGGGRGAMYMKETMGIYGRVCGPATTTVQLFEEETCMMDDNATPSKPSHLLDEDSQSSVKSSTNDSNKKSKFADLFDSNKVWTAADVKEYMWPPPDTPNAEPQMVMIQEQVAMFLGVKSFKRRYPELKRRTVGGDERDYLLTKGIVSEALCDLGITAVDASEVLDIMLSDYPHKYEEYRSHQRERQIASSTEEAVEIKTEERATKVEIKSEKTSEKPEPPKVDPEKARLDMAAAAIASAAEWNARANQWRRPACVDLQSNTVHRRRPPIVPPRDVTVCPPAGFYPHALLPGQYQHWYRVYTADQLRYFPLNTVLAAPPAAPSPADSSSDSEGSWGERSSSSDDSDAPQHHAAKRKKLSRVKRSSQQEKEKEESREPEADTCRVCKLRLEANRKHTHERFLVCANCNAKLHPLCVELPADTIRKCREYAWQCAECKTCCSCRRPQDDDKMLFCDLCDRGFHIYCVGLDAVPSGRWHCVECAICKSCGARDPNGLNPVAPGTPGPSTPGPSTPGPSTPGVSTGEWHHQTRRGPGGHKVYSHSLCTPCARAYRIGRYCPLCERSFIGPKGTMQLVICKLCDRQLHQECVRQTVAALRVLDYTCAECRRGGITSRAAAVRAAPRTIATLFMAKRRFNKYAHRQYMASRLQALDDPLAGVGDAPAPSDLSGDAPAPSDLSGDVPAPSELSGDVPAPSDLSGDAPAASDLSGDVPAPSDLSGDAPAPSEHSGD